MAVGTHRAAPGRAATSYPRSLLGYIALSIAIVLYLIILPGDPSLSGGLPWGWLAIHGALIFFVLRRSATAWVVLLMLEILVTLSLVYLTVWPWSLKLWGLFAMQLCVTAALLAPDARRYIWGPVGRRSVRRDKRA